MSENSEIRIGQMSDLHLGYRQYGKFERVKDFYSAAASAAELIIVQKPDLVLIPGDLFHKSLPYPVEQRHAISILNFFREKNIPVVVIRGNHDASYAWTKRQGGNEIDVLQDLGLVIYLEDEVREIELKDGKRVRLGGLGYHGGDASAALTALVEGNTELLSDKSMPNILILHEYLENLVPTARLSEYAIDIHGFDYVALGHYHGWWENGTGKMCSSGSTEHVSAAEWDELDRSVALVLLEKKRTSWKSTINRLTYKVRPKVRKTLDLGTLTISEAKKQVSDSLAELDDKDIILRLDVKGTLSDTQAGFYIASLAAEATKAFHVTVVPEMDYVGLPIREDISDVDVMRDVFVERL
ncbi:MAG: hypothetical protein E4H14_17140 [Candidatus Thorarchaeota archaeon]|nr:MAG: hypothetical protein E4H14_17140 [Candidatus Thorarchaeota archaeon]